MSYLFDKYAKYYDSFMARFKLDDNKAILKAVESTTPLNILDIGGGSGKLAKELALFHNVHVIDQSDAMLSKINSPLKINIIAADFFEYEFKNKFDVVVFRDVLHHLLRQEEALVKASSLLNDNGKIIVFDFERSAFQTKVIFLFERLCFEKIKPTNSVEIKKILENLGYKTQINSLNKRDYLLVGKKL